MTRTVWIGVDIGGTFTDLVLVDERSGALHVGKLLTSAKDPAEAVEHGIARLLADSERGPDTISAVLHATTLATNALIEKKGALAALVATQGFADTIEIAREGRYDMYDLQIEPPAPLVPAAWRREVRERVLADGTVLVPLDEAEARGVLREIAARGAEALAISLLHAYANPAHEARLAALAREVAPDLPVSCSSDVIPEIREYERTSTTVANAYVMPIVARYLARLERTLGDLGAGGRFFVMLSSGGLATPATAARVPVRLVESGPAAGALAASRLAASAGEPRVLSFDMGGTTAKACLIDDGRPLLARDFEAARADRFKKGSGLPIRIPVIELIEIGAGGGSIARVDRMGLLKVGPDSAGADPGPACYALGGTQPTVTDADLLLGYLDPDFFLGGRMRLDRERAERAVHEIVARPAGLDTTRAAWGIHRVVNEGMAAAARIHAIERGRDAQGYTLLAFGGAGPVHAWHVARILRVPRMLVPFGAGAMSALGLLAAPLAFDLVRTARERLDRADWDRLESLYREMEAEGRAILTASGVADADITVQRAAEMRYVGQGHEVEVEIPAEPLGRDSLTAIVARFETAYRALYHRTPHGIAVETLNCSLRVAGPTPASWEAAGRSSPAPRSLDLRGVPVETGSVAAALKGRRPAFFGDGPGGGAFVETAVYDRYRLAAGVAFDGPAIVEERESTTVIGPGGRCRVEPDGTLRLELPR